MKLARKSHIDTRTGNDYATNEDLCKLFTEDITTLYLLCFMLTANHETAEQCFVDGLDDCMNGNSVYKEFARSWARRRIIQCAIRVIAPGVQHTNSVLNVWSRSEESASLTAILELDTFERFVFVMSMLEGYSDQECSLLLGCSRGEVVTARGLALRRLSKLDIAHVSPFAGASIHTADKAQTLNEGEQ